MASKFDTLREGKAVQWKKDVSARLNKEKKRLELSTGEYYDVADDPDFYPKDEHSLKVSREKEKIQKGIGKTSFGKLNHQLSQKGLVGSGKDIWEYVTKSADDYLASKQAQRETSERISEESPWTSAGATALSMIPDIALTRGMSAAKAAPLITAGSSGSRLITAPGEVAQESALASLAGKGLDMTGNYFNRVAKRRGEIRSLTGQKAEVKEANRLGKFANEEFNAAQKAEHNVARDRVRNENAALKHQHKLNNSGPSIAEQQAKMLAEQSRVLKNDAAYKTFVPSIEKTIQQDVDSILSSMKGVDKKVASNISKGASDAVKGIEGADFINRLQSGEIVKDISNRIAPIEYFFEKIAPGISPQDIAKISKDPNHILYKTYVKAANAQKEFSDRLSQQLNLRFSDIGAQNPGLMGKSAQKAPGIASQNMAQNANPSGSVSKPLPPTMAPEPTPPINRPFLAQPEPSLPPASNFAESTGNFLEQNLLGGRTLTNNPLTKLAGLKYVLGKGALPLEAGYLALKGLTSPTPGGQMARLSFKQAGIQAIEQMAQKYRTYHDGVIEDPQERRSMTKEIEDDPEIPLEQKALMQSKINRGKPLTHRIQ